MKIGNINNNLNVSQSVREKGVKDTGINTVDVFTSSSGEGADLKSVSGTLSAKDAGKILMGNKNDAQSIRTNTVEKPEWREHGGILSNMEVVFDSENNCLYAGVEEVPMNSHHNHWLTSYNPDGSIRWKFKGDALRQGPVLDKNKNLYFCGMDNLHALDKDGNELWNVPLETLFSPGATPVVSPDGTVFAINPDYDNEQENSRINCVKDGKVKWTYNTSPWGSDNNSMMVGKDGTLFLAATKNVKEKGFIFSKNKRQDFFIGLKPDGTEKFRVPAKGWSKNLQGCLAQGNNGTVYTVQGGKHLVAYTPEGKEIFSKTFTRKVNDRETTLSTRLPPVIDKDDNVYIAAESYDSNELICLDKNGNEQWSFPVEGVFNTKPHFTKEGNIIVGFDGGGMHVLDKKGNVKKRFLVKSGLYKNRFYGNTEGDKPLTPSRLALDGNGKVFVGAYEWLSAYDLDANPLEQVVSDIEAQAAAETRDNTIKMEEKTVTIGGVTLKKNQTPD